jgi:methionyl-tRNA formyltransferase
MAKHRIIDRVMGRRGRVVFVGAVHEAEAALAAVLQSAAEVVSVVTPTREIAGRLSGTVDLEPLARQFGVAVLRTPDLNSPDDIERLRMLSPDLIVVVGWTRLLGREVLAIPPRGCVGFHASLLPYGRGRAPVNWAILRGETMTGNTFMYLSPEADAGDIIDQRPVLIEPEDTCATVYAKVAQAGAEMLTEHLPGVLNGTAPRTPQGKAVGDPLPKRTPDMGITDWNRPARAVHDWIRALSHPYPGAFTFLEGKKVFLWYSDPPGNGAPAAIEPGVIQGVDGEALRVATRDGSIRITRVQEDGGPEETGASWLRRCGAGRRRFDPVDEKESRRALGLEVPPRRAS